MNRIYTQHWMELSRPIQDHLRQIFNVGRSGPTEVRDQTVITDGTTNNDLLAAFTLESLQKYTGTDVKFSEQWPITCLKAERELKKIARGDEKPFCDQCDSNGVRHKNGCPNKTF